MLNAGPSEICVFTMARRGLPSVRGPCSAWRRWLYRVTVREVMLLVSLAYTKLSSLLLTVFR